MGGAAGQSPVWLTVSSDFVTLQVLAQPGKSKAGFVRSDPRGLVVALNAPPQGGRANDELIGLLSRALKVPRSAFALIRGTTSRAKTIRIETANPPALAARIRALLPSPD